MPESSGNEKTAPREDLRKEVRDAIRMLRREVDRARKDIQGVIRETEKFVDEMAPKVQATIEDSMEKASEAFRRAMVAIDRQTRPQQARMLENYKSFLETQLGRVEKRLKELKASKTE